jgi:hemerythrin
MINKRGTDCSAGIGFIDEQHQLFRAVMSKLLEAMKNGEGKDEIVRTMRFVELHILKYFPKEEAFMVEKKYKDIEFHVTQHKSFKADFEEIKEAYRTKGYFVSLPLMLQRKMQDWLTHHIQKSDSILCDFVNSSELHQKEIG